MPSSLKVQDVTLSFSVADGDDLQVLKKVSAELPVAAKCGLIGQSGSGKTSLLTIIAGLRRPTAGNVELLGTNMNSLNEEELAKFRRDNIGIVFQNYHLLPAMTALENTAIPLELAGADNAEDRANEALKLVGLGERVNHFPHQLSGGEQQRTAIARAFVAQPKIILADEPTGNLDSKTSEMVMETLAKLTAEKDVTLLFITHNNALLEDMTMVLKMDDGHLTVA